ncbi:MAG: hypothetical protein IMF09_10235 [Proteobacteria bacterium]|nr:hypothetical protein [Pseudomonadota bacterium]
MPEQIRNRRWQLIRDSLVFQGKLIIDGVRDLLLVPAALIATILGLIIHPREPDYYFKQVISWGRDSESWINLFGKNNESIKTSQLDDLVLIAEEKIRAEYDKGGITASVKDAIDRGMDKTHASQGPEQPGDKKT